MDSRLKVVYYQKISMYGKLRYVHSEFSVNSILDIPSLNAQVRYALGKHTRPQITSPSQEEESGTGYEDPLGSMPFLREMVLLWVLSDQSLGLCVHGGRPSVQTRWLHKHTVTRGAAEVHPALDSPVVFTHCHVKLHTNPDPLSKLHPSDVVDRSLSLPHPHLLPRGHPVRELSCGGALVPAGVP